MNEMLIISPHLDDAVLSCCNYITYLKNKNYRVTVLTIFSKYRDGCISPGQNIIMADNQVDNLLDYESLRKKEDQNAMEKLNVSFHYFDLLDAGFRHKNGEPTYMSYEEFTQKMDIKQEKEIIDLVMKKLTDYGYKGNVLLPLTVGSHIDHQLSRYCGELFFERSKIHYYVDFPYARNPFKWSFRNFLDVIKLRVFVKLMTRQKRKTLDCYQSQVRYFFKFPPFYPEIILYR